MPVRHRDRLPLRAHSRSHRAPGRALDHPADPQTPDGSRRPRRGLPVPGPRPGRAVHRIVRRSSGQRRHPGRDDPAPEPSRERRTGAPTRGRSYTAPRPAPRPGAPRTARPPPRRPHRRSPGHIQPPGQHERRQQRVAHPAAPAPHPRNEDPHAAPGLADVTPVPRPEHQRPPTQRARRTREPRPPARHRIGIDWQRGTAIPWPQATPPRIPSRDRRQTRREGIPHLTTGIATILTRTSPARQQHEQRARPGTTRGCSGNQAVNIMRRRRSAGSGTWPTHYERAPEMPEQPSTANDGD